MILLHLFDASEVEFLQTDGSRIKGDKRGCGGMSPSFNPADMLTCQDYTNPPLQQAHSRNAAAAGGGKLKKTQEAGLKRKEGRSGTET